jgi:hypothetical protein
MFDEPTTLTQLVSPTFWDPTGKRICTGRVTFGGTWATFGGRYEFAGLLTASGAWFISKYDIDTRRSYI